MFSKLKSLLKKKETLTRTPPESVKTSDPPVSQTRPAEPQSRQKKPGEGKGGDAPVRHAQTRTKKGIRVIKPDEDLGQLFGVDESMEDPPSSKSESGPAPGVPSESGKKKKAPRLNKHGFPIMDNRDDFEAAMLGREDTPPEEATPETSLSSVTHGPDKEDAARNKHGIRILTDDDMPFDMGDTKQPEPKFEDLLYQSLGNKSMDVLIHEKKQAEKKRKKPTTKELLKRYPAPQGQLDLHGYTALKAELRVESYLKSAFHNQTHTVNIIVGKGLHSEEGAVLPDVVEAKLNGFKKQGLVLSYEWDKKRKSRSGAVIVYLNNWPYA